MIAESFDTTTNDIIITGDFDFNMLSNDGNKLNELMNQYNLKQSVRERTHYNTESSSSFIDLSLFRNPATVLYSGVTDPIIPDQIRYH